MSRHLLATALALPLAFSTAPIAAQAPQVDLPNLSMEQRAALRCGVAFGLIAKGQAEGDPRAAAYPPMEPRGREFFVRTMAQLMDEEGLTRDQVNRLAFDTTMELTKEAPAAREKMMPTCLLMLEASGL